jgi:hypothetical protein
MQQPGFSHIYKLTDEDIVLALSSILSQAATGNSMIAEQKGEEIIFTETENHEQYFRSNIDQFKAEGGILLFLYSVIVSKGV